MIDWVFPVRLHDYYLTLMIIGRELGKSGIYQTPPTWDHIQNQVIQNQAYAEPPSVEVPGGGQAGMQLRVVNVSQSMLSYQGGKKRRQKHIQANIRETPAALQGWVRTLSRHTNQFRSHVARLETHKVSKA